MLGAPAKEAPRAILMAAISSSACSTTSPIFSGLGCQGQTDRGGRAHGIKGKKFQTRGQGPKGQGLIPGKDQF